ncbi:hypothetical protein SH1V18_27820 [Vallitalea longa]|uniref:DUF4446 family protein n=1 Tax=Vallitalea longa TaxID=2936439 RepID=A0A9W6DG92_9FIRM|nr:DUF4446 family protein [Vallitalea longa]GKX30302.1 hypothetical protein SH1V18_27820 [Vallitalea longa]
MEMLNYYIPNNISVIILVISGITLLLLILLIVNSIRIKKWKNKYYQFMNTKDDFNIEDVLQNNIKNIKELKDTLKEQKLEIRDLDKHVKQSIEKTAIVKYNAFDNMGGQLSFVLALLNQNDSGLLLNGMHSREGCYIYIKEIVNGKSNKVLSDEEKSALEDAINFNK